MLGGGGIVLFSQAPDLRFGTAGRVGPALGVGVLYVNQIKVLRGWFPMVRRLLTEDDKLSVYLDPDRIWIIPDSSSPEA